MKMTLKGGFATVWLMLAGAVITANATLSLSGTSYSQNFNSIGSGLPAGWSVNTGASDSSLGTVGATYTAAATSWGAGTGAFRNMASFGSGLASGASVANQAAATDRALGIRQIDTFGDPGAAFVLGIANTAGLNNFSLALDLQMLSVQGRSTVWSVQYGLGASPSSFITLGTFLDPASFGSTLFTLNSAALSGIDNQSQEVWFRVAALSATTGSNSRDTFAIDNFSLTYSVIPPAGAVPETSTVYAGLGLGLIMLGSFVRRNRE